MESKNHQLIRHTTFLLPLTALAFGILSEERLSFSLYTSILCSAFGLILVAVIYFLLNHFSSTPLKTLKLGKYHGVWIFTVFASIGFLTSSLSRDNLPSLSVLNNGYTCHGEISQYETIARGDRIIVNANRLTAPDGNTIYPGNLKITLITDVVSCKEGDYITFPCRLRSQINDSTPKHIANSLFRSGNLYYQFANKNELTIAEPSKLLTKSKQYLNSIRNALIIAIDKGGTTTETSSFLKAIVLGDKTHLLKDTKAIFSDSGVSHIIALSGLHVTIIAGLISLLLYPLKIFGLSRLRMLLAIACIWIYIALTGFPISAVRAGLMTSLLLCGIVLERKRSSFNTLCASVFIILLFDPKAIGDCGLHLSVLAVASIILFAGPLNPVDRRAHPKTHKIISALLTTMTATAGTWVVTAYLFGTYPLLFLPANLLIVPFLPIYLYLTVFHILLQTTGINTDWLAYSLDKGYEYIINTASLFGSGQAAVNSIEMPAIFMIFWLVAMAAAAYFLNFKTRRA